MRRAFLAFAATITVGAGVAFDVTGTDANSLEVEGRFPPVDAVEAEFVFDVLVTIAGSLDVEGWLSPVVIGGLSTAQVLAANVCYCASDLSEGRLVVLRWLPRCSDRVMSTMWSPSPGYRSLLSPGPGAASIWASSELWLPWLIDPRTRRCGGAAQ